jgi:hypothetical protein
VLSTTFASLLSDNNVSNTNFEDDVALFTFSLSLSMLYYNQNHNLSYSIQKNAQFFMYFFWASYSSSLLSFI